MSALARWRQPRITPGKGRWILADLRVEIQFSQCIGDLSRVGVRASETVEWKSGSRRYQLTFDRNPLPYGCEYTGYNIRGFVGSNPAGNDRATLPWACLCARIDGAVCTLTADDFKTYCLPGAGADCDQDEAWTRECVRAQASGDKDGQRLGRLLSPILGREFRQAGRGCESNEKNGGRR